MTKLNKKESWVFTACKISTFLLFMDSMYPWYMWNNKLSILAKVITIVLFGLLWATEPKQFRITHTLFSSSIIIFISLFWLYLVKLSFFNVTLTFFSILFPLFLRDKERLLDFITKWFALFLLISWIAYVLYWIGISFSPYYMTYRDGRYASMNYYLFIIDPSLEDTIRAFRFKSIFMEPGHLTMGLIPLIMANRFNLRNKYVVILSVIELFTLSLAGWITWFVGFFLFNFTLKHLKYLFFTIVALSFSFYILEKTGNDEILDTLIFDRLEVNNGKLAGDNRSGNIDAAFSHIMQSSDKWFGMQVVDAASLGDSSGYKRFILDYGLISLILILILYTSFLFIYKKYDIAVITLILLMLLYQNGYPYWYCVILMYILGCENLKKKYKIKNNNEKNTILSYQ